MPHPIAENNTIIESIESQMEREADRRNARLARARSTGIEDKRYLKAAKEKTVKQVFVQLDRPLDNLRFEEVNINALRDIVRSKNPALRFDAYNQEQTAARKAIIDPAYRWIFESRSANEALKQSIIGKKPNMRVLEQSLFGAKKSYLLMDSPNYHRDTHVYDETDEIKELFGEVPKREKGSAFTKNKHRRRGITYATLDEDADAVEHNAARNKMYQARRDARKRELKLLAKSHEVTATVIDPEYTFDHFDLVPVVIRKPVRNEEDDYTITPVRHDYVVPEVKDDVWDFLKKSYKSKNSPSLIESDYSKFDMTPTEWQLLKLSELYYNDLFSSGRQLTPEEVKDYTAVSIRLHDLEMPVPVPEKKVKQKKKVKHEKKKKESLHPLKVKQKNDSALYNDNTVSDNAKLSLTTNSGKKVQVKKKKAAKLAARIEKRAEFRARKDLGLEEKKFETESGMMDSIAYALPMMKVFFDSSEEEMEFLAFLKPLLHPIESLRDKVGVDWAHMVEMIISLIVYVYQIYRSRNVLDKVAAIAAYLRSSDISKENLLVKQCVEEFIDTLGFPGSIFDTVCFNTEAGEFEEKVENPENALTRLSFFLNTVYNSHFVATTKKLVMGMISTKLMPGTFAKRITTLFGKPEKMNIMELVMYLVDALGDLSHMFYAWLDNVPITELVFCGDPVTLWFNESRKALDLEDMTYLGLPVEGKICRKIYRTMLGKLIESGEDLRKKVNAWDTRKRKIESTLKDLVRIASAIDTYVKTHNRIAPIGVVIFGFPGIGKANLTRLTLQIHNKIKRPDVPFNDYMMYSRSRSSEYMEGYNSASMPYMHYSEVGNESKQMAQQQIADYFIELNSICDSLPFQCNMAFALKGEVYAEPEVVIIDTNNRDMWISVWTNCKSAFYRRFIFVDVAVLPEFRMEGTTAIDPLKSFEAGGNMMDRYSFKITEYHANGNDAIPHVVAENIRIDEYVAHMADVYTEHIKKQEANKDLCNFTFIDEIVESRRAKGLSDKGKLRTETFVDGSLKFDERWVGDPALDNRVDFDAHYYEEKYRDEDEPRLSEGSESFETEAYSLHECADMIGTSIASCAHSFKENFGKLTWREEVECFRQSLVDVTQLITYSFLFFFFKYDVLNYRRNVVSCILLFLLYCSCYKMVAFSLVVVRIYPDLASLATAWMFKSLEKYAHLVVDTKIDSFRFKLGLVRRKYNNPYAWAGLATVVAGIYFVKRTFFSVASKYRTEGNVTSFKLDSEFNAELRSMEEAVGIKPKPIRVKQQNGAHWVVPDLTTGVSVFKGNARELNLAIFPNVRMCQVFVDIDGVESNVMTHILGIKSSYALINAHALAGQTKARLHVYSKYLSRHEIAKETGYKVVHINFEQIRWVSEDVLLIDMTNMLFRNIVHHFGDLSFTRGVGTIDCDTISLFVEDVRVEMEDKRIGSVVLTRPIQYNYAAHYAGLCGHPVFLNSGQNNAFIVAIHAGGMKNSSSCAAAPVSRTRLENELNAFDAEKRKKDKLVLMSEGDLDFFRTHPNVHSAFAHEEFANLDYFGSDGSKVIFNDSKLKKTAYGPILVPFIESVFERKHDTEFSCPMMRPGKRDGVWYSPLNIGLHKMDQSSPEIDQPVLDHVVDVFSEHIICLLGERGVTETSPLTIGEGINGVPGDQFISRVNASTSAGYGNKGLKSDYLPIIVDEETKEGDVVYREPVNKIKEELVRAKRAYDRGYCLVPIISCQLKDEPREISKCKTGKTRLFYMSPLAFLIFSRMYLSPFFSLMVQHCDIFCAAIGTNVFVDSDARYKKMIAFSPYIMEGDYGGFDLRMPVEIGLAASAVILRVLRRLGYNEEALKYTSGILSDNLFPMIAMFGDLFRKPGLQSSGKYATAEDNSLRGMIMLMYAWYSHPELKHLNFFDYVLPLVYGDDLLASVKPEVTHLFNNVYYAEFVEKRLGMEFTNAQKTADFSKTLSMDEVSFLKRKFKYDERFERYTALLDFNSICKTLTWMMPSENVPVQEQAVGALTSMLWELFFYTSSKDQFDLVRNKFIETFCEVFGLEPGYAKFPTYDGIVAALDF